MRYFVLFIYLLTTNLILGQINHINDETGTFQTGNIDSPFLRVSEKSGNKIEGNIYLNDSWQQAVVTNNSSQNSTVLARFNAYHSEIETLNNGTVNALLPTPGIFVTLNNKKFTSVLLDKKTKPIFAEILVNKKNKLFKAYSIKINKAPSDAKLLNIESIDKVVIKSTLYYQKNERILKFPSSKKEIKEKLPAEMIRTAKRENLSLKKEEDILKLFQLLD